LSNERSTHALGDHGTLSIALVNDFIYPFSKGGVEKRVFDIAKQLAMRGHEVHLIGTKEWQGPSEIRQENVMLHGVRSSTKRHNGSGRRSIWQAFVCSLRVSRRLASGHYDVIDVQSMAPLTCLFSVLVARAKRIPVVVTWHEVWGSYWREYLGILGYVGQVIERLIARVQRLGVEEPCLVPNGVDLSLVDAVDKARSASDVICVSRLVKHKNIRMLIDAIALMNADGVHPEVSIIGSGPEHVDLIRYAASLGVENLNFLTDVETETQLLSLLKASRISVQPSLREGFGLAALEASACGLPTLVVDHPENASTEFVHPDLILPLDPEAFANKIRALLEDGELWLKQSTYSRESAGLYDFGWIMNRLERTYRGLSASLPRTGHS
jgi:glycosyltransferase involved in cell wall biosynthesis